MKCENCGQEHDGTYGSGRFCSSKCARSFSTKNKRADINKKVSNTVNEKYKNIHRYCSLCGTRIRKSNKSGYCRNCLINAPECKEILHNIGKKASSHITHFREKTNPIYNKNYIPPKNNTDYIYEEHNNLEISKWIDYINSLSITIPQYEIRQSQGYFCLKENCTIHHKGTHFIFEHNYLMNIILNGKLKSINTVHHIDNNGLNNSLNNLMVFETNADHKRFHNSKYSWLIYNSENHLFRCILKK